MFDLFLFVHLFQEMAEFKTTVNRQALKDACGN